MPNSDASGELPPGPYGRSQFLLAPRATAVPDGWTTVELGHRQLVHHPSLRCSVAGAGPRAVAILGYCIDADHPDRTEAATAELLVRCASAKELGRACRPLGGPLQIGRYRREAHRDGVFGAWHRGCSTSG